MGHIFWPVTEGFPASHGIVVIQDHVALRETSGFIVRLTYSLVLVVLVLGCSEFWDASFSLGCNLQRQRQQVWDLDQETALGPLERLPLDLFAYS